MENETPFFEPLFDRAEVYGKTSYELLRLKTVDKTAGVVSTYISRGIALFVLSLFMITLSIGAAFWIGELLGKVYYGFFCVAGFYAVVWVIVYFFMHKSIKERAGNSIVSQMLN